MICKIKDDLKNRKCLNFKTHKIESDTDMGKSLSVKMGGYSGRIKRETCDWSIGLDSFRCGLRGRPGTGL